MRVADARGAKTEMRKYKKRKRIAAKIQKKKTNRGENSKNENVDCLRHHPCACRARSGNFLTCCVGFVLNLYLSLEATKVEFNFNIRVYGFCFSGS